MKIYGRDILPLCLTLDDQTKVKSLSMNGSVAEQWIVVYSCFFAETAQAMMRRRDVILHAFLSKNAIYLSTSTEQFVVHLDVLLPCFQC